MSRASFEVHIASHYREDRVAILHAQLQQIALWRDCDISVTVYTNTRDYETTAVLSELKSYYEARGLTLSFSVITGLKDPWLLTWAHKPAVCRWLDRGAGGQQFFIYMEDDILLTYSNVLYLTRELGVLSKHGLIPGLVRYEKTETQTRLVDVYYPENWRWQRNVRVAGRRYHSNRNPYWAGYILDRQLALEYIKSRSFDERRSAAVTHWGLAERAAMGLTFEAPPRRLKSRTVIPLINGRPDPDCLVWHCSNTYTAKAHRIVARLSPEKAYPRFSLLSFLAHRIPHLLMRKRR